MEPFNRILTDEQEEDCFQLAEATRRYQIDPSEHIFQTITSKTSKLNDEGILTSQEVEDILQKAEVGLGQPKPSLSTHNAQALTSKIAKLDDSKLPKLYIRREGPIARADIKRLLEKENSGQTSGLVRRVEDPVAKKKRDQEAKKATAGPDWYNLPRTNLTPELKRDLQLLRLRGTLDAKQHYKKDNERSQYPTFSQVGTLQEGSANFYSARIPKRERKRTFVEEVLAGEHETGRFKRKYLEVQSAKRSGKKGHYKAMIAKRRGNKLKR